MRLDNDLIRIMLLQIELDVNGSRNYEITGYCNDRFPECPNEAVYHMKYLFDAGFVQPGNGWLRDLTPAGHDFLRNIREDGVWAKTKESLKPFGQVAIGLVSEVAASILRKSLGLS
jgi:hypothetical protein